MQNTLIDNSKSFRLVDYLNEILSFPDIRQMKIATGYWDLPGTSLIKDRLEAFLSNGGKLELMIGQEPQLRSYQMRSNLSEEERFPDFYIQRDINKLSDDYRPVVELILKYTDIDANLYSLLRLVKGSGELKIAPQKGIWIEGRFFASLMKKARYATILAAVAYCSDMKKSMNSLQPTGITDSTGRISPFTANVKTARFKESIWSILLSMSMVIAQNGSEKMVSGIISPGYNGNALSILGMAPCSLKLQAPTFTEEMCLRDWTGNWHLVA